MAGGYLFPPPPPPPPPPSSLIPIHAHSHHHQHPYNIHPHPHQHPPHSHPHLPIRPAPSSYLVQAPPTADSRTQLFVGNLPFRVRWQDLKDLFRKAGTVLRTDVALTPDNRSKGFGTVLFAQRSDAMRAIEIYNGFNWQTRSLDVRLDQHDPNGAITISNSISAPSSSATNKTATAKNRKTNSNNNDNISLSRTSTSSTSSSSSAPSPPVTLPLPLPLPNLNRLSAATAQSELITNASSAQEQPAKTTNPLSEDHLVASLKNSISSANHHTLKALRPPFRPSPHTLTLSDPSLDLSTLLSHSYQKNPDHTHHHPSSTYATNQTAPYHSNNQHHGSDRHLFVGNLPFDYQWQDLKDLFRQAGQILRADVVLGADGRSRGFGTVLFGNSQDAEKARQMFDGYELKGRVLKVHVDRFGQPYNNTNTNNTTNGSRSIYNNNSTVIDQRPQSVGVGPPDWSEPHHARGGQLNYHQGYYHPTISHQNGIWLNTEIEKTETHDLGERLDNKLTIDERRIIPKIETSPAEENNAVAGAAKLSPIASKRSTHKMPPPEPIGNNLKPSSITMPPPYDLSGLTPINLVIQRSPVIGNNNLNITPSMPAFSFQALPPVTPPLLPQFFSPGIGASQEREMELNTPPGCLKALGEDEESEEEEEEAEDEEDRNQKMNRSNVDWGFSTLKQENQRRASCFGNDTNKQFVCKKIMSREKNRIIEEAEEDVFNGMGTRRASFDVSSLKNSSLGRLQQTGTTSCWNNKGIVGLGFVESIWE